MTNDCGGGLHAYHLSRLGYIIYFLLAAHALPAFFSFFLPRSKDGMKVKHHERHY